MRDVNIHVEHVTRVEGHGSITLDTKSGSVDNVTWTVTEAPRLFEAFVRDKPYHELAQITSRICGICSIGHSLASLKATENALGIEVTEQTKKLRRIALHGENMQSHMLHIGYLVAPDLFGADSVVPMVSSHPGEVKAIIALHRLANEFSDMICGRTTHPINLVVGGMAKTPSPVLLRKLRKKIEDGFATFEAVANVVLQNAGGLPDFNRETEYIGLVSDDEYALYEGMVGSTDTGRHPVEEYESIVNEYVVPQSTAKYSRHNRESYLVGALARFNLNADKLSPRAKEWAEKFGLKPINTNPYMMTVAQLVEFVHSMEDTIGIIDDLLSGDYKVEQPVAIERRSGRGIGSVEVPRGILFHDYTYENGICKKANCVIPTNQNHANIQFDMEELAPMILEKTEKEIELTLEMLVRAYDPCISCSTHYLDVRFK